jgi:hypothetical protein
MSENFLGRWSRRKQEAREEPPPARVDEPETTAIPLPAAEVPVPAAAVPAHEPAELPEEPPPPTLEDARALTSESDFRPFVARNVAPEVKNTAFRKLFADPQFNVMDRMDVYIDDYSQSTPIPHNVLRQMASAKFLKLFEQEEKEEAEAEALNNGAAAPDVAQSEPPEDPSSQPVADAQPASQTTDDHHADLRLQPDDAARAEDARRGAG